MLHVRTLGELRQTSDGPSRTLRRKPLALLAYVARRAPRAVSRTELATLLWGERGEERAKQSLRQALSELKQALGSAIEIDGDSVRLVGDAVELDIIAFERDLAANKVQEAAQRWSGEFFDEAEDIGGEGFLRWIESERTTLHRQLGAAMTRLIHEAQLRGDLGGAAAWAQRWVVALPFDEEANRRLVETLGSSGRNADALREHAAFVTRLRAARDAEPSPEFLRLADALTREARDELGKRGRAPAAVHAPAFVGRDAVMAALLDAWNGVARAEPVVVLLEGVAGCGLTRTCDELAARVGAAGTILRGRGTGAKDAYACAAELFAGVATAEGSAGAAPETLAEVARIVPALRRQYAHLPQALGGDAAALRDALADTLAAIGEEQPVLLVLDDLNDADDATRALIGSLASRLTGRVMLLLAADESKRDASSTELLGARQLTLLPLGSLSTDDVDAMIASMVDMDDGERRLLAVRVCAETAGLPRDVRELVTSLIKDHLLVFDAGVGRWRLKRDAPQVAGATRAPAPRPDARRRWAMWGLAATALAAVVIFAVRVSLAFATRKGDDIPILALGHIADYRDRATSEVTKPLTDMLATNLGRVPGLRVVSTARMYELLSQGNRQGDTSSAALVAAARRAGATELLDGALYAPTAGTLRLDLRRVELSTGDIRKTHSITGRDLFELADSGTARLANDFGEATPIGSIADVTTRSIPAYRLYEQGLRAYYANDLQAAQPLFEAALREDSTFAMAAFYSAMSMSSNTPTEVIDRYRLAGRLATRTSDRERLTILSHVAFLTSSPSLFALADTLVVRYPDETDGYLFTGLARLQEGAFLEALPPLNRAVAMDSLGLSGSRTRCGACDALRQIQSAYLLADSLPAAQRELRRWIRLQPRSPVPWQFLADVYSYQGRSNEALAALDSQAILDQGRRERERLLSLAVHRIYAYDFDQADRLLEGEIESRARFRMAQGLWFRGISYRLQGRLNEALADARQYRALANANVSRDADRTGQASDGAMLEAQVLYEMGRYRASAALFDSVALWADLEWVPSRKAHTVVWAMTHAAGALAAAGDTLGLIRRVDTIEALGSQSLLGRDRLLHHYVRGLLLAARGDDEVAISELRKAVWSWSFGYTRVNVALARVLLERGQARQAVSVLQSALRGPIESSNLYVSRTEIHEQLGHAWAAVGTPASRDSAAAHLAVVAHAWRRADPSFSGRLSRAKAR